MTVEIKETKKHGTVYTLKIKDNDMILMLNCLPPDSIIRLQLVQALYEHITLDDLIDGELISELRADDEVLIYEARKQYLKNWLGFEI